MKQKKTCFFVLGLCCMALAFLLLAYPLANNAIMERNQTRIQMANSQAPETEEDDSLRVEREETNAYNQMLASGTAQEGSVRKYEDLLNTGENGLMGYIEIPAISAYLPIYHGTEAQTLEQGVGHIQGSSLPVGGASTHAVLPGHSGLASAKLFSDLEFVKEGDFFYLHILGEVLTYQVDQISVVLPEDISLLSIQTGEDYVTLVTCTPFGVNTHRLLVRGHRVEKAVTTETATTAPSAWESEYEKKALYGLLLLGIAVSAAVLLQRKFKMR